MGIAGDTPVLKPLSVAEILDAAFRIYRRNFALLIATGAAVFVPMEVVFSLLRLFFFGTAGLTNPRATAVHGLTGGDLLIEAAVLILMEALAYGALAVVASRSYFGQPVTLREAYSRVFPCVSRLMAAMVLVAVLDLAGGVLCLVPGVVVWVFLAFTMVAVVLEDRGPIAAMWRSEDLVAGYWGRAFGAKLLLTLLFLVASAPYLYLNHLLLHGPLHNWAVSLALQSGLGAVTLVLVRPVYVAGMVVLYYDQRVRKEGFDVQVLADGLAATGGGPEDAAAALGMMPLEADEDEARVAREDTSEREPLTPSEVAGMALRLYLRYFPKLVGTAAAVYFPLKVVQLFLPRLLFGNRAPLAKTGYAGLAVPALVYVGAEVLAYCGLVVAANRLWAGEAPMTVGEAYSYVARRGRRILGVSALGLPLVLVGTALLVMPGVYLLVVLGLALIAVLLEDYEAGPALARGRDLVRGRWSYVLKTGLLLFMIVGVGSLPDVAVGSLLGEGMVSNFIVADVSARILSFVTMVLLAPFFAFGMVVLYHDQRALLEGDKGAGGPGGGPEEGETRREERGEQEPGGAYLPGEAAWGLPNPSPRPMPAPLGVPPAAPDDVEDPRV